MAVSTYDEIPSPYEQVIDHILENQEPQIRSRTQCGFEISPGRLGYAGRFEFPSSSGLMMEQEIAFCWKAGDAEDRHHQFRKLFYRLVDTGAIDPMKVDHDLVAIMPTCDDDEGNDQARPSKELPYVTFSESIVFLTPDEIADD